MYSSIFWVKAVKLWSPERISTTKSGQTGANRFLSLSLISAQRSFVIHARSGARSEPLGNLNPVEESNPAPNWAVSFQIPNFTVNLKFR